jgi:hypothetical protein
VVGGDEKTFCLVSDSPAPGAIFIAKLSSIQIVAILYFYLLRRS